MDKEMKKIILYLFLITVGSTIPLMYFYFSSTVVLTFENTFPSVSNKFTNINYVIGTKYKNDEILIKTTVYKENYDNDSYIEFLSTHKLFIMIYDKDGFLIKEEELPLRGYYYDVSSNVMFQDISIPFNSKDYRSINNIKYSTQYIGK